MRQLLLGLLIGASTMTLILSGMAHARPPVPGPVFKAVRANWTRRVDRIAAFNIAWCESRFSIWARNGTYENLFQMGYNERRTYGWHTAGSSPFLAARAAHRYWVASGRDWSPWSCNPWSAT